MSSADHAFTVQDIPGGKRSPGSLRTLSRKMREASRDAVDSDEEAKPLLGCRMEIKIHSSFTFPVLQIVRDDGEVFNFRITRAAVKNIRAQFDKAESVCRQFNSSYGGSR